MLPCTLLGQLLVLYAWSRICWYLDFCGRVLEVLLMGIKLGVMGVLYWHFELGQITLHITYFGLRTGCYLRILCDGLHNELAIISFHGIEHSAVSLL